MKSSILTCITAITLLAALAVAVRLRLAAQEQPAVQGADAQHTRYKVIAIGTLGGPTSYPSISRPGYQIITNSGIVGLSADNSIPDPSPPNCANPHCFVSHTARWEKGVLTDLGTLPGVGFSSGASAGNARGWIAGASGTTDPLTGMPVGRAVLWRDGQIIDLGNFGGTVSLAITLNNAGQVVGAAINTIPDPFPLFAPPTQSRAFLWQDGVMHDLDTLGGPDAMALSINERGQVAGISYTDPNETINPTTGMPTVHAFLWHGTMTDLGTLGGTVSGPGYPGGEGSLLVNNRGQVIGDSSLSGDQTFHPFLWDHGVLRDLGTLGGDNGAAVWLTDTGEVVGYADLPGSQDHDAFLWRNGVMTDLGNLGGDSAGFMMNSRGQIVGRSRLHLTPSNCPSQSRECIRHAFLWENGAMLDLNTLTPPGSNMLLYEADNINERGEIVAWALPADCDNRDLCGQLVLLVPCDANDPSGCENANVSTSAATQNNPAPSFNSSTISPLRRPTASGMGAWRARLAQRYHIPGALTRPAE
jgi:probable HAF family extracellular repeat protein